MNKRTIRYAIVGCIAALVATVAYAVVKLYVLAQRADASIIFTNVILFAIIAGVFIYLTVKERNAEEEELFKD